MPTIRVEMFEGRSAEQKRALAKELTDGCVRVLGVPPASVQVLLFDVPKQHWAAGGTLMSDVASKPAA
jgi:4-oxalocrotonate tautomerase